MKTSLGPGALPLPSSTDSQRPTLARMCTPSAGFWATSSRAFIPRTRRATSRRLPLQTCPMTCARLSSRQRSSSPVRAIKVRLSSSARYTTRLARRTAQLWPPRPYHAVPQMHTPRPRQGEHAQSPLCALLPPLPWWRCFSPCVSLWPTRPPVPRAQAAAAPYQAATQPSSLHSRTRQTPKQPWTPSLLASHTGRQVMAAYMPSTRSRTTPTERLRIPVLPSPATRTMAASSSRTSRSFPSLPPVRRRTKAPFSTANVSARSNGYGGITVSGTVTLEKEGTTRLLSSDYGVCLTAILRDASGNSVGGGVNFLSSHPAEGSSIPFEVPIFEQVDYATCEVHALAW